MEGNIAGTNDDLQISEIDEAVRGETNPKLRAEVEAIGSQEEGQSQMIDTTNNN